MIQLEVIKQSDATLQLEMQRHYSQPKGFVGRNICYAVICDDVRYGSIVAGSATRFLPGREDFFSVARVPLNKVINNIFFHIEPMGVCPVGYPLRNFAATVLKVFRSVSAVDWKAKYGDEIIGFESLVELPRTGECYKRDGWTLCGQTKGYTCKRVAGKGTDSWSGKRVWDTENLRPKLVFVRRR